MQYASRIKIFTSKVLHAQLGCELLHLHRIQTFVRTTDFNMSVAQNKVRNKCNFSGKSPKHACLFLILYNDNLTIQY